MEIVFGLIGQTLSHSFSKMYFDEKFFREGLRDHRYELFTLEKIDALPQLIKETRGLSGLNVTIPYKEVVMPFLTSIDPQAQKIGAVNVIRIDGEEWQGFNTDAEAFHDTLEKWIPARSGLTALVLGTGGSSRAVRSALEELGIGYHTVSRTASKGDFTYEHLKGDRKILGDARLIINTTPLGMTPETDTMPPITYEFLTPGHYVYDLIYNPARTIFLQKAEMRGATIKNGLEMLQIQAEKSWSLWTG